jgi:septum site-determining protein MinD
MADGIVFAIAGAKGGVGKTTTSINLSAVLAEFGRSVVLVELDVAMANVGDFLDVDVRLESGEDPTLHEVLAGTATVAEATYEAPGGFDVIPSGTSLAGFAAADIDRAAAVVAEACTTHDVVILDTGAGLGPETLLPLTLADETILVSSPRVAAVRDTSKTRDLVRRVDGSVAGVVFVKSGSGWSPGVERIAEFLAVDLLGHIPEDAAVSRAQDSGKPVVVAHGDSDAARAYGALGSRINERIDTLRAEKVTEERAAARAAAAAAALEDETDDTDDPDEEALATGDGDASGFDFVDEDPEVTAADEPDSGPNDAAASDAAGRADTEASTDTETDTDPGGGDARAASRAEASAGRGESAPRAAPGTGGHGEGTGTDRTDDAESADRVSVGRGEVGRRRGAGGPRRGATDEEIAARLAEVEGTLDDGADDTDADPDTDETATGDDPEEPEDWESKQSATKRFIDRAISIVDRRDD